MWESSGSYISLVWLGRGLSGRVEGVDRMKIQSPNVQTFKEPKIDSKEPIPPGCVAWRSGTTTLYPY